MKRWDLLEDVFPILEIPGNSMKLCKFTGG